MDDDDPEMSGSPMDVDADGDEMMRMNMAAAVIEATRPLAFQRQGTRLP